MDNKKIYFASDFHLGINGVDSSLVREKKIVQWLTEIEKDAAEIFLVGDLFDFWFEYRRSVPKGFVRLLGKLADLSDKKIPVHVFIGNHDMWMFDYLPEETGVQLHREPVERTFSGKKFYIGHGDGLGPGDRGYKFIKKVFRNRFCQWMFARIHPNTGIAVANYFSRSSRKKTKHENKYLGDEKEYLVQYIKEMEKKKHYDFYVFGHRHLPIRMKVENSDYINLGDWIEFYTYAEFNGETVALKKYDQPPIR